MIAKRLVKLDELTPLNSNTTSIGMEKSINYIEYKANYTTIKVNQLVGLSLKNDVMGIYMSSVNGYYIKIFEDNDYLYVIYFASDSRFEYGKISKLDNSYIRISNFKVFNNNNLYLDDIYVYFKNRKDSNIRDVYVETGEVSNTYAGTSFSQYIDSFEYDENFRFSVMVKFSSPSSYKIGFSNVSIAYDTDDLYPMIDLTLDKEPLTYMHEKDLNNPIRVLSEKDIKNKDVLIQQGFKLNDMGMWEVSSN